MMDISQGRLEAESIWRAAVEAVRPGVVLRSGLREPTIAALLHGAQRIIVVGAGKAWAAMAETIEQTIPDLLGHVEGIVNVPNESVRPLKAIRLHAARAAGSNHPTAEGVAGAEEILRLVANAGPQDVVLCLLSGGGSALLPALAQGVSLDDKQQITKLLHACGATINEMNAVRKHLSRIKGGRLAQAFHGKALCTLIISDVIGDPLDVIASGPTAPDPTTFGDALAVLERYNLMKAAPAAAVGHLQAGAAGQVPETPKHLPINVTNHVLANNAVALVAAAAQAERMGYSVCNLGSFIQGETRQVASVFAAVVRSIRRDQQPLWPPACVLSGGETTVTLAAGHGKGGRNQEFVLATAFELGAKDLEKVVVFSGGTDGEDGPTDAAGAIADATTLNRAELQSLDPAAHLMRNDAYHFFEATGDLFKPGLTESNVMDVRVILVGCKDHL
jgi:glycerate 2-kinase